MAENILVIMGSPRNAGNTAKLCRAFAQGAQSAGKICKTFNVGGKKIAACTGCGWCKKHDGACIQKDDMTALYGAFERADGVLLASPLYFQTISAQLKTVIDRLYAPGVVVNFRYPKKSVGLIMTGGENEEDTFISAVGLYDRMLTRCFLQWDDRGRLCVGGCRPDGVLPDNHPAIEKARKMGETF